MDEIRAGFLTDIDAAKATVAPKAINLETAVDRFLALDTPYELQLLSAPARSLQW